VKGRLIVVGLGSSGTFATALGLFASLAVRQAYALGGSYNTTAATQASTAGQGQRAKLEQGLDGEKLVPTNGEANCSERIGLAHPILNARAARRRLLQRGAGPRRTTMAYDHGVAARLRAALMRARPQALIDERKTFGGIALLLDGSIAWGC